MTVTACLAALALSSSVACSASAQRLQDRLELGGGLTYGGSWSDLPADAPEWYRQHAWLGGGIEARAVWRRTWVVALRGEYLASSSGVTILGGGAQHGEHRASVEAGFAVRAQIAGGTRAALALELGVSPCVAFLFGSSNPRARQTLGGSVELRLVADLRGAVIAFGLRGRLGFTIDHFEREEIMLLGAISFAHASAL